MRFLDVRIFPCRARDVWFRSEKRDNNFPNALNNQNDKSSRTSVISQFVLILILL